MCSGQQAGLCSSRSSSQPDIQAQEHGQIHTAGHILLFLEFLLGQASPRDQGWILYNLIPSPDTPLTTSLFYPSSEALPTVSHSPRPVC